MNAARKQSLGQMTFEFTVLIECSAESAAYSTADGSTHCTTNSTANRTTDSAAHSTADSATNRSSKWGNNLFHSNFLLRQGVDMTRILHPTLNAYSWSRRRVAREATDSGNR